MNDSGLGAAMIGGGIDDELKQPIFSVGLKVGLWGWVGFGLGIGWGLRFWSLICLL